MADVELLRYGRCSELYKKRLDALPEKDHEARNQLIAENNFTLDYLINKIRSIYPTKCIHCSAPLQAIDLLNYRESLAVVTQRCNICGWWYSSLDTFPDDDDFCMTVYYPSVLIEMEPVDEKDFPLDLLFQELRKKQDALYRVDPTLFERFVGEVLHQVYDCEVLHIGRTGDGGIDLILLHSDKPIAVQVKRRESMSYVEEVNVIREFIGAMVLKNYRKGIFVSTAKRYSRGSEKLVRKDIPSCLAIDRLDLWNYQKLIEMYKLTNIPIGFKPWLELECYKRYSEFRVLF